MKNFSLIQVLLLTIILTFSGLAFAQDGADFEEVDVVAEETADEFIGITEHEIAEDLAAEHKERIFEREDIIALRGTPKTYSDGFNTFVNDKIQFKLTASDNILTDRIMYRINDGQEQVYTGPFTLKEEGSQVIYYYSIDKMGNREELRNLNVIVDTTAPEVIVTITAPFSKTDGKIYASDKFKYDYSISARDNIAGVGSVAYSIEGGEYMEYLKPFSINSLKPVNISIAAEDRVGNLTKKFITKIVDQSGKILAESIDDIEILVDSTPPVVEITPDREFFIKGETKKVASRDYRYTITASDYESGVDAIYYRINSRSDFILYTGPIQFNSNGWHKIEAIARDNVGNVSKAVALDVYVDTIPASTDIKLLTE